jgi:hypothetical protein
MKKHALDFIQRGFVGATFGPIVLAIIYSILGATNVTDTLSVKEVVLGIISISVMAFIAAGITMIYKVENLPLISAILIHGLALYADYAIIYLINGWISEGLIPFLIFTSIFIVGYAITWSIVYICIKNKTNKLNKRLSSEK